LEQNRLLPINNLLLNFIAADAENARASSSSRETYGTLSNVSNASEDIEAQLLPPSSDPIEGEKIGKFLAIITSGAFPGGMNILVGLANSTVIRSTISKVIFKIDLSFFILNGMLIFVVTIVAVQQVHGPRSAFLSTNIVYIIVYASLGASAICFVLGSVVLII
jgi:hypothetical protein